ncbi:MAG TPA: hypothetical protein VFA34_11695 [Actinomycetota bacterium]|jgi:hypothetical protein|nr:hypothetical protein [Actinomycetota bacterium]
MILSKQGNFSEAQAITTTAASTNIIDRGAPGTPLGAPTTVPRDLGKSMIPILCQVVETFATLTSLQVTLQADDDSAFGSPTTVDITPAIAAATLVAGYKFPMLQLPPGITERYIRLNYTVAGSAATAGKITAGLVAAVQTNP